MSDQKSASRTPSAARKPPKAAAADARPPEAAPKTSPEAPATPEPDFILSAEHRSQIEKLSMNLARAAVTAQAALAEMTLRQADQPAALAPDPFHVGPALGEVLGRLTAQPDRLMRAQADLFTRYLDLWQATARRMQDGEVRPVAAPERGDRRFSDPEWSDNPLFDTIKQSYLITSGWLNGLMAEVDGVDPLEKRRAEVFMRLLTDAFSPSNFLVSNPVAMRELLASGGESLVRGMENFAADLERGEGRLAIAQTDYEMFRVGENVAVSPGKVVFRNTVLELIQYAPTTETVHQIPLLIFPPWINKFYILDLRPENSMIRWLTDQGLTVFVASWVNPGPELADKTFEDYMREGIYAASAAAIEQTGAPQVNAVGYCIGGTLLASALAHMAAKGVQPVASATFFAAQQDFSEAGDLRLFTNDAWLKTLEDKMDQGGGVLPSHAMADTFNMLRANDLIWSFFVNNYLLGKEPKPFDLLFWNSDQTRMPKALHLFYLRRFYGDNALSKGELELDGVRLDLGKVTIPVYLQSAKDDHIAPARSVYNSARLFGGPTTFMMSGSGHIAGVINAPAAAKYQHWTAASLPPTLAEWQAQAVENPGSWWPHWGAWLKARSGPMVPARDPAKGPLAPLCDAPGEYVKVRS